MTDSNEAVSPRYPLNTVLTISANLCHLSKFNAAIKSLSYLIQNFQILNLSSISSTFLLTLNFHIN